MNTIQTIRGFIDLTKEYKSELIIALKVLLNVVYVAVPIVFSVFFALYFFCYNFFDSLHFNMSDLGVNKLDLVLSFFFKHWLSFIFELSMILLTLIFLTAFFGLSFVSLGKINKIMIISHLFSKGGVWQFFLWFLGCVFVVLIIVLLSIILGKFSLYDNFWRDLLLQSNFFSGLLDESGFRATFFSFLWGYICLLFIMSHKNGTMSLFHTRDYSSWVSKRSLYLLLCMALQLAAFSSGSAIANDYKNNDSEYSHLNTQIVEGDEVKPIINCWSSYSFYISLDGKTLYSKEPDGTIDKIFLKDKEKSFYQNFLKRSKDNAV